MEHETESAQLEPRPIELPEHWTTAPSLEDLKQNFNDAKSAHDVEEAKRQAYAENLNITGSAKPKTGKGFSTVQPRLIRKMAEWRYAALSEAFLSNQNLFKLKPRTHADVLAAKQNELLLNYQWNNVIDKVAFVDSLVRAGVDEGTGFTRLGWASESRTELKEVPIYNFVPAQDQEQVQELQQAAMLRAKDPYAFKQHTPEHIQQALMLTEQHGQAIYPVLGEMQEVEEEVLLRNEPTLEVCNSSNCYPDPSCNGDLSQAQFFAYSFETCKSDLRREGRYFNLEQINTGSDGLSNSPEHDASHRDGFTFKDDPRAKFVAYEYVGYWDVDGSGTTTPIIAAWVGDILIRMEESPFPFAGTPYDSVQYLPVRNSLYGEPDGALLVENQKIIGAVTRGAIDLMARSANGQEGIRQDALDAVNKRKYKNGENYEFRSTVDPSQAMIQHTYPEIPNSVGLMLNLQESDANNLTGIRAFGATDSSAGTATADRGVLDAASKRENGILRRFSQLMTQIGKKMIAMNAEFLSDEEILRITDSDFVTIRREDLKGNFDLEVTIASVEEDNAKAQEAAFMLQTMGNTIPLEMSQLVLSEIFTLRKMPGIAKRIEDYKPEPDPMQQQLQQLEMERLQLENAKLRMEIGNEQADTLLKQAKAQETMASAGNKQSDTDQKNLDFLEQQSGITHARNMQQDQAQAEGNMALEILKADLASEAPKPKSL